MKETYGRQKSVLSGGLCALDQLQGFWIWERRRRERKREVVLLILVHVPFIVKLEEVGSRFDNNKRLLLSL